jgi:hypothetical protein
VILLILALGLSAVFVTYWIAQIVFFCLHLAWTNRLIPSDESDAKAAVTVIHPTKDLDHEQYLNFESWLRQGYRGPP